MLGESHSHVYQSFFLGESHSHVYHLLLLGESHSHVCQSLLLGESHSHVYQSEVLLNLFVCSVIYLSTHSFCLIFHELFLYLVIYWFTCLSIFLWIGELIILPFSYLALKLFIYSFFNSFIYFLLNKNQIKTRTLASFQFQ